MDQLPDGTFRWTTPSGRTYDTEPTRYPRTTVDGALKLYARDPSAPPLTWQGDREIADALAGVKAVLG